MELDGVIRTEGGFIGRVGNSQSQTLDINDLLGEGYSGEYYTVRVYGASRSCNLSPTFCSSLVWKTSAQKAFDYESALNNVLVISSTGDITSTQVSWENSTVAIFQNGGSYTVTVPQTDFYRVAFDVLGDSSGSGSTSELCIFFNGVRTMNSIPLRSDMTFQDGSISGSCSPFEGSIGIRIMPSSSYSCERILL